MAVGCHVIYVNERLLMSITQVLILFLLEDDSTECVAVRVTRTCFGTPLRKVIKRYVGRE